MDKSSEYGRITVQETIKVLETSLHGLTDSEAKRRIEKFGYNEVEEKEKNPLVDFVSRYWGPMQWLLELTIALSCVLRHYLEVILIFGLLTINVIIGFHQTQSSKIALHLLKKRLAVKARVLRNGNWAIKNAREMVPGDIITVGSGDLVPADVKIISGQVSIDQSALTGERARFLLLGVYGLVVEPLKLSQVLFALVFSGLFTLALDLPKYYIFRKLEL